MRKFFGILLIVLLAAPFLVSYCILEQEKSAVKKEIKHRMLEGISPEELVTLGFSKPEAAGMLKWKHSKEFEYGCKMYDVVYVSETADSIFYSCWEDNEETALNRKLRELVAVAMGHNQQQKERQRLVSGFFSGLFFECITENRYCPEKHDILFGNLKNFYQSSRICPPSPPPEYC